MSNHASQPKESEHVRIDDDRDAIDAIADRMLEAAERFGYDQASQFALRLALEEAVLNGFRHGHASLPAPAPVDVRWSVSGEEARIEVQDQGPGFNPKAVADPTLEENLEKPTGRGIMLMRAYMTSIEYNDAGNRVTMRFVRQPSTGGDNAD